MTYNTPPLFVVSGADGVGKTTTTALTEKILADKGINVFSFHHMLTGSLGTLSDQNSNHKFTGKRQKKPIWKLFIPRPLKVLITSIRDEYKYMAGVNYMLTLAKHTKKIALCDRYVYDRLITLRLKKRPLIHQLTVRTVCILLRKPTLTIVMTEDPEIIRGRRQELTETEISTYQSEFINFCRTIKAPLHTLPADQRSPEFVAEDLARIIINSLKTID